MQRHEEWEGALTTLAILLNNCFFDFDASRQTHSYKDILSLAYGLPGQDRGAKEYLMERLRTWQRLGFIKLNESDNERFVEVIQGGFPELPKDNLPT